jgi:hypothetical protein
VWVPDAYRYNVTLMPQPRALYCGIECVWMYLFSFSNKVATKNTDSEFINTHKTRCNWINNPHSNMYFFPLSNYLKCSHNVSVAHVYQQPNLIWLVCRDFLAIQNTWFDYFPHLAMVKAVMESLSRLCTLVMWCYGHN